jgi:hypothetical protein
MKCSRRQIPSHSVFAGHHHRRPLTWVREDTCQVLQTCPGGHFRRRPARVPEKPSLCRTWSEIQNVCERRMREWTADAAVQRKKMRATKAMQR